MLLAGGAGLIGGYYLGRMIGGMSRPYGYGYGGYGGGYGYGPSPYQTYVPYRDRYEAQYPSTPPPPGASGQVRYTVRDILYEIYCTGKHPLQDVPQKRRSPFQPFENTQEITGRKRGFFVV